MNRHATDRRPKPSRLFAWARFAGESSATYRLFRRDQNGALHVETLTVYVIESPTITAKALRIARRRLRDRVDEIDLLRMGVTA